MLRYEMLELDSRPNYGRRTSLLAALVLSIMSSLDILLTRVMLDMGGREVNPIMVDWVETGGALFAKTIGAAVIAFTFAIVVKSPALIRFIYGVTFAYCGIVLWNMLMILLS